jgi:predicted O-linked N-acetylglucosamine transferase (SPINDLY family)
LKGCVKNCKELLKEALFFYQKSYNTDPNFIPLLIDIGNVFKKLKEYDKAITFYEKVLEKDPNNKGTLNNMGLVYGIKENFSKAKYYFLKCLDINQDYYELIEDKFEFWQDYFLSRDLNEEVLKYLIGFSEVLTLLNYIEESLFILDYIEIKKFKTKDRLYLAKGNLFSKIGDAKTSIKNHIKGINIKSDNLSILNNVISLYYYDNYDIEEYKHYLNLFNSSQEEKKIYTNFFNKNNKKIKIGYLGPDFNSHSIIYFLFPIYMNHNREDFEIFSYYIHSKVDKDTELFKQYSDKWRHVYNLDDKEIAEIIHNDKVDILVDLGGFTDKSRIEIFAYKPAPVQISMIGYFGSTGLKTVDYKILDKHLSENMSDYFVEKIINIPDTMYCYKPDNILPDIKELPYLKNNYLTFGSFNNGIKITEKTILLWSKLLNKYKNSKIIIKCRQNEYMLFRERILNTFKKFGINSKRIEFFNRIKYAYNHLDFYNNIDISLDTYPYNGVTTTFESLIMGVPVLTFTGDVCSSRAGKSILTNLSLNNWIVDNFEKDINIDLDNLEYLRKNLREKLLSSVLCDHKGFTLKLENIYRQILRR